MVCILLDSRTKSNAKRIVAVDNIPSKKEKAIYKSGLDYLREEHRKPAVSGLDRYHFQLLQGGAMKMGYYLELQLGKKD
ncbi:Hypothetical protein PHPALM_36261 [Phytophthora palmivora]|uniref:Uncharacterized protein n=1 Tax=Phytophthora palmivora TaxID=4796 RepID=A0A2P4X0D3_9STRA|nr:Hypothetical protein PHPALM_36261 [Phytophthora palmivora]